MTDRPIIFSGPMVQALLDGRKTQTRRVLRPQPDIPSDVRTTGVQGHGPIYFSAFWAENGEAHYRLPYAPGDRLWVREAWRCKDTCDDVAPRNMSPNMPVRWEASGAVSQPDALYWIALEQRHVPVSYGRLRSSIHMPRWASRLTLHVTDVRVQRLQEISGPDAIAEGILEAEVGDSDIMYSGTHWTYPVPFKHLHHWPEDAFRELWDSIHGPDAWGANPWVAAITFTVERANIDSARSAA